MPAPTTEKPASIAQPPPAQTQTPPPAQDPKPPEAKPAEPPKPGAMSSMSSRLKGTIRGSDAPPKEPEKKGLTDTKPAEAPPVEAPPATPAPAKAPAKRVIRRAAGYEPQPTDKAVDKLAQAADKLADAATKVGQQPAPPAAAPKAEFTKAEQRQLKVLEAMQELYPERYSNIAKNAQRFIEELPDWETKWNDDFAKAWDKKNGEKYDDDDKRAAALQKARDAAYEEALEDRRKKYNIDYDEEDFEDAKDHLRTKPVKEELQKTQAELEALRKDKAQRDVKPVAEEHGQLAVQDIAANLKSQLGDEFDGILSEDGAIVAEKLDLIADAPFVKRVLEGTAKQAKEFAEAVVIAFNGGQTPLLPEVERFCIWAEQKKSQAPEAEQRDDQGRMFAKRADYFKMTPAEQKKHWLLDAETAITMRNDEFLRAAKAGIDDARAIAAEVEAHKGKLGKARGTGAQPQTTPAAAPASAAPAKTPSAKPVMATATDAPPNGAPKTDDGRSYMQSRLSQSVVGGPKAAV